MIDHLAEEEFLSTVEIERYWLHWEDLETGEEITSYDPND